MLNEKTINTTQPDENIESRLEKCWMCEGEGMIEYMFTEDPYERVESPRHLIQWLGGSFIGIWPSKKRMYLLRESLYFWDKEDARLPSYA